MRYDPSREGYKCCETHNLGGVTFNKSSENPHLKEMRLLTLLWLLLKIFFRYGNREVYYHVCGSLGENAYDCPMEAENVEVRLSNCGPKVTIW